MQDEKKSEMDISCGHCVISIGAYAAVLLKPVEASAEQAVKGNLESQFTVSASILPISGMVLNSVTAGNVSEIPYLPGMEVKEGRSF